MEIIVGMVVICTWVVVGTVAYREILNEERI